MDRTKTYSAFVGDRRVASGEPRTLVEALLGEGSAAHSVLIFEDQTGEQVELDLRGSVAEILERAAPPVPERAGPGRPKLGVVSREVSLLPRHWEWLAAEPQGTSAALRRLVDEARKKNPGEQRARQARAAVNKFLTAVAGNREHFEEATRALFAKDDARFEELIAGWPADIREHARRMLADAARALPPE